MGFSKSHDPAGTTTGPSRAVGPPWQVWFAWYPVRVKDHWEDWGNMTGEWKHRWRWLGPVARRKLYDRIHAPARWEYAPAHFAITQEGR